MKFSYPYQVPKIEELNTLKTAGRKALDKGIKYGKEIEKSNITKNLLDVLDDKTIALKTQLSINIIQKSRLATHTSKRHN